jgi:uncharacterized SAM-binding protein YcdF (DUF218 family)
VHSFILAFIGQLVSPGDVTLVLLTFGVTSLWFTKIRKIGIILSTIALFIFLIIGYLPIASWLAAPLENRFPNVRVLPRHVDGLIVLGGAVDPATTLARKVPTLTAEAERMTEFQKQN